MFAFKELVASKEIDGAVFRGGHQPSARIVRNTGLRPALQSDDQSVLGELLGQAYIADNACETCDEPGRLDSSDGVNDAMRFGG